MGYIGGGERSGTRRGPGSAFLQVIDPAVPGTPVAEGLGVVLNIGGGSGLGPLELDAAPRNAELMGFILVLRILDEEILATANRTFHFLTPKKFSAVGGRLS
jgi:hypothetical protein